MIKRLIAQRNARIVSRFYNNGKADEKNYQVAKNIFMLIYSTGRKIKLPYLLKCNNSFGNWAKNVSGMYNLPQNN